MTIEANTDNPTYNAGYKKAVDGGRPGAPAGMPVFDAIEFMQGYWAGIEYTRENGLWNHVDAHAFEDAA